MDAAFGWIHWLEQIATAQPTLMNALITAATLVSGLAALVAIVGSTFAGLKWLKGKLRNARAPDPKLSDPPVAERSLARR
ncbi:hypothetical protein [uncultured Lamprocystis sp.]|jgi:hypothetical protein|uniref:hypothetical protein n=1 Tax=uncultured Lamprocystis sp. TaxID=543132 RepID=UPI0025CEA303|nr:hypothetical protein [uncultured Lamprocystis sp.]